MGEHAPRNPESTAEKLLPLEHSPEIRDQKIEQTAETQKDTEKNIERAKTAAEHEAVSARETSKGKQENRKAVSTSPIITSEIREESFKHTMRQIQTQMPPAARVFSKIIHNPAIERMSDAVGTTIARPHAILSGSIFACLAVLGLYLMARHYGFALAGSETIIAFGSGWILGIVFDFLRVLVTGKRQ